MATLQSQINILAASLAQLYDDINNPGTGGGCDCNDKFSLVKLNYTNSENVSNGTFQSLPTYVLAMDIDSSFPCAQYDVSLGIYKSTVDEHTFEYVVPEKYTKHEGDGGLGYSQIGNKFQDEFIHGRFTDDDNLKILLNFPQLISLDSDLSLNPIYIDTTNGTTKTNYNELINADEGESISFKKRSSSTEQRSETIKKLRNMQTQIESQPEETCIDLVNENFESILYNNVYQLTENGNLTLKENTKHQLKKHLTLPQSDYIYILECDTNSKYHIE